MSTNLERARELKYEAERLAECLIAVLASVYSQKRSFAHPGDDISAKVTEIILEHDTQVQAEAREQLAAWMIRHSFATGHGDTFTDLLKELEWQVKELRAQAAAPAKGDK